MGLQDFKKESKLRSLYFEEVVKACSSLLYNHPIAESALSYLNSRVSSKNQEVFQYGYYPSDNYIDTILSMVDKDKLYYLHLLYNKYINDGNINIPIICGSLSYHNLVIPYRDMYGDIVALVGRSLHSENERKDLGISKYKNTTFTKSLQLFGLNLAKNSIITNNSVLIVEGQIDCITARANGYYNVVALGGVAFTQYQFNMLNRYTDNIYLILDNDQEGQNAMAKIIQRYGHLANFKIISIPSRYKDLDEALKNGFSLNI